MALLLPPAPPPNQSAVDRIGPVVESQSQLIPDWSIKEAEGRDFDLKFERNSEVTYKPQEGFGLGEESKNVGRTRSSVSSN